MMGLSFGLSLEPVDFCKKWLPGDPGERGWRARAVRFLALHLKLEVGTVDNWGTEFVKCPDTQKAHLATLDQLLALRAAIKEAKAILNEAANESEQ